MKRDKRSDDLNLADAKLGEPNNSEPGLDISMPRPDRRAGLTPRHILFAGVAGACVLGVGLGLWARPALSERQAAAPLKSTARPRKLEIVVDNHPAPIGAPIDVLPHGTASRSGLLPAFPSELTQSATMTTPRDLTPLRTVAHPAPQTPKLVVKPKLAPVIVAAVSAPRPVAAKTKPRAPARIRLAKAEPPPKPEHKADVAREAAAKAQAHRIELAQAVKTAKDERLEKVKLAKAARQRQIALAKAEAKGRAEALKEAKVQALAEAREDEHKRQRLAALAHAFKRALPHLATPHAASVELAKLERKGGRKPHQAPKLQRASLKTHRPPALPPPPVRTHAVPFAPLQHSSGLMRVSAPRCASHDPGEALVCADPSLGAADRQLTRAYQSARAAGVPDMQLRQQQQRWLSARTSAAREAPWAVHDVYMARIAELNGLAREAHGDGY